VGVPPVADEAKGLVPRRRAAHAFVLDSAPQAPRIPRGQVAGVGAQPRADRGKPRAHKPKVIARAVALKRDQPYRSHVAINKFLKKEFGRTMPISSLYRHLRQANVTRIKLGISRTKVRRRWTRDYSNALWVGDFEEGPTCSTRAKSSPRISRASSIAIAVPVSRPATEPVAKAPRGAHI